VFPALLFAISVHSITAADFTGHWRQQTESGAQRQLDIDQHGQTLLVKTTVINSKGSRRLEVKYEIGGSETSYKGLDGDRFRSSVHWDGSTLVFNTVEHEGGRKIPETTVWSLSGNGNQLQVKRQSAKPGKTADSLTLYVRRQP
jgi:hypothetical protein